MDKKLLESLSNLSYALEDIASALKSKSEAQSATAKAFKGGDFIKEIKEISVGVKQLQKDTKKILSNQETIIRLSKQKTSETQAEKLGEDKKGQSNFKDGLKVILLIAVAVLALGAAFKLIGTVNFLSVIALSIALPLLAIGFEKVHKTLKKSGFDPKKDSVNFIIAIVSISTAILLSSFILGLVKPVGFTKMLTAIMISAGFALMAPTMGKLIKVFKDMSWGGIAKAAVGLVMVMPAISLGVALSSYALQLVKPVGFAQILTMIGIAIGFTVISFGLKKLVSAFKDIGPVAIWQATKFLPKLLAAVSLAIALSSWSLQLVKPVGFAQMLSAIGIALVFTVVSYGFAKIIGAFKKISVEDALMAQAFMPLLLIAFSFAMSMSSKFFATITPISWMQFLTAIGISLVFTIISFGIRVILKAISKMKWQDIPKLPVFFTLVSSAIWLSSRILSDVKPMDFMSMLKVIGFSIGLAIIGAVFGVVVWLFDKLKIELGKAIKAGLIMVSISGTILATSKILDKVAPMSFDRLVNLVVYSVVLAVASAVVAAAFWVFDKFKIGLGQAIKGSLILVAISTAITTSSIILSKGKYTNYPNWKWLVGAGLSLLAFAKIIKSNKAIGIVDAIKGGIVILILAGVILATSVILNIGKYKNFPSLSWIIGVGASLAAFGIAAVLLGTQVLNPFFYAGFGMILLVAGTIYATSLILAKGKYDNKGMLSWAVATSLLFATFTPIILILGTVGVAAAALGAIFGDAANPFEAGRKMLSDIAWSIVTVSFILAKGDYKGGPTKEWAKGVALSIGAFGQVYEMLVRNSVMSAFGMGGVGPAEFTQAIITVSMGIRAAAEIFAGANTAFINGPPVKWARGVGLAIGAFAPVFATLQENSGWFSDGQDSVAGMSTAIMTISRGIIDAANFFAENKAAFNDNYPSVKWGQGVGAAIAAFAPVFTALSEDTGLFTSGDEVIQNMKSGITIIGSAIVDVASQFANSKVSFDIFPSKAWATGVGVSVTKFKQVLATFGGEEELETFKVRSRTLASIVSSMAVIAVMLDKYKKQFSFKLDSNFVKNIRPNIVGFAKLALEVDKLLVTEKTVTTDESKFGGLMKKTSTKKVKERRDLSLVADLAAQLVKVAKILSFGEKYFKMDASSLSSFTRSIDKSFRSFARLVKDMNQMVTGEWGPGVFNPIITDSTMTRWWSGGRPEFGKINEIAYSMVKVAQILSFGKGYFDFNLNPNYVKSLSTNVKDYSKLVKYLSSETSVGDMISSFFGAEDPVSQAAYGMIKMASAFDQLAQSLNRFSGAIKTIDGAKVNMIRKLTGNIAILSSMDSKMFANMLKVLETKSSVFAKLLDVEGRSGDLKGRPSVGDKKDDKKSVWPQKSKEQGPTDEKGENALVKLDRIAEILKKVAKSTDDVASIGTQQAKSAMKLEKQMKKVAKNTKE